MAPSQTESRRKPIVLAPGAGRAYPMGRISAVFKADEGETESRYSVSEWWLEPRTQGPGAHSHPEDDLFYVIEGVMSVRAGILDFSSPGPFEPAMPDIAAWFAANPPQDTAA